MFKLRLLISILAMIFVTSVSAEDAADGNKGMQIAKEAKLRDSGWQDVVVEMKMTLRDSEGEETVRSLKSKTLEGDLGNKSLTIIELPRDVRGTAFLTHEQPEGSDDQWIYLPALKRVKRIASKDKSGPFMGSEFSYEDMSSLGNIQLGKYDYKYLREEKFEDQDCYVLEVTPKDEYSAYSRFLVWYDKAEYRRQKVELFDRKNSLIKTLSFSGYKQYQGNIWRVSKMAMVNHVNGKSTDIEWSNFQFANGLDSSEFTKGMLKRKF